MSKRALGRGISALLKDIEADTGATETRDVPIKALKPNPYQPRGRFPDEGLQELADSIREKGIIQPLLVEANEDGSFTVIAGERRLRAAGIAGLRNVPVLVRRFSMVEKIEIALIENIQRSELNPIDRAAAYAAYMSGLSLTQEQASHRLGQDRSTIANYVRLLELDKEVRQFLADGKISMGHARALLALADPADQRKLAKRIAEKNLSVRRTEDLVRRARQASSASPAAVEDLAKQANLRELEDTLSRRLGRRVRIRSRSERGNGDIVISFASLDEFDELIAKLCGN